MVLETRSKDLLGQELQHAIVGLAGEVGEVSEMIKKHLWHGRALDYDKLELEIGDVLWYLHSLCETTGISLESALQRNTEKLRARHPDGFNTGYHDK